MELLKARTDQNRVSLVSRRLLVVLTLGLPFFIYSCIVYSYALNVPFWDDYTVVVESTAEFVESSSLQERVDLLVSPHNAVPGVSGHIPLLTRGFFVAQYYVTGSINIKHALLFANSGWLLTAVVLLLYLKLASDIQSLYLIPVPYILLSFAHWEAMDFITAAMQMYWGNALLPVLFFLCLTKGRDLFSVLIFAAALFESAGNLALYPLAALYLFVERRWMSAVSFLLPATILLGVFFTINPPQLGSPHSLPPVFWMIEYIVGFMGNLFSGGSYDLRPLTLLQRLIGTVLLLAGFYLVLRVPRCHFLKLGFLYVVFIAIMAAYANFTRPGGGSFTMVPRYSIFPLMGVVFACGLFLAQMRHINKLWLSVWFLTVMSFWIQGLVVTQTPLTENWESRSRYARSFAQSESSTALRYMFFNAEQGAEILKKAKRTGVYDYLVVLKDRGNP